MDIKCLVEKQREFFYTDYTKDVDHRLNVLKNIKDWMIRHEDLII